MQKDKRGDGPRGLLPLLFFCLNVSADSSSVTRVY